MMHSSCAMSVCGQIVELGSSLMGVVWHGVSFRIFDRSRRMARTALLRHLDGSWRQGQLQAAKLQRSARDCRAVTPQGTWPPYAPSKGIVAVLITSFCPVVDIRKSASFKIAVCRLGFRGFTKKWDLDCLSCGEHCKWSLTPNNSLGVA